MGLKRENRIARLFRYITSRRVEFSLFPLVIKLSVRESARLLKNLESPPPPNAELKKALALYEEAIGTKP
jgi:hypothetical protein